MLVESLVKCLSVPVYLLWVLKLFLRPYILFSLQQTPYNHQSPEELLGNFTGYTTAVDLWAVGRMFSEILTGERLFVERNRVAQLTAIFEYLSVLTTTSFALALHV